MLKDNYFRTFIKKNVILKSSFLIKTKQVFINVLGQV